MNIRNIYSKKGAIFKQIVPYLCSRNKKTLIQQIREILLLKEYYNCTPYNYMYYFMYMNSFRDDIRDYIPLNLITNYQKNISSNLSVDNVNNKKNFSEIMALNKLPVLSNIYVISSSKKIRDMENKVVDFSEFIGTLICSGETDFFIKPSTGIHGEDVYKITLKNSSLVLDSDIITTESHFYDKLFLKSKYKEFIVQPAFHQHELLSKINGSSVNTIRIDTFVSNGQVYNNGAFLRMSIGNKYVDNFSQGGIAVGINLESGVLDDNGVLMSKYGTRWLQQHPLSHFCFQGTAIPFWNEIKKLVCSAALILLPLKWLGWDVAIGKDGPVLVEANHNHEYYFVQKFAGGLRKKPIGQEILQTLLLNRV